MSPKENMKDAAKAKPCHVCGEHHAGICKFCPRCRIFHNDSVGCRAKKVARSAGTFAHQVLPLKRGAGEMESGEMLEGRQGKRVNFSLGEVAAAAAEQQHGGEESESVEGEGEQQEGEVVEGDRGEDGKDESWRERIDLRAVECCEHQVQLSAPPFPFRQYWDPQYDTKKKRSARESLRMQRRASPDYTVGSRA